MSSNKPDKKKPDENKSKSGAAFTIIPDELREKIQYIAFETNGQYFYEPTVDKLVKLINDAREEQVMQDELSLRDFDIDEAELIKWREERIKSINGDV